MVCNSETSFNLFRCKAVCILVGIMRRIFMLLTLSAVFGCTETVGDLKQKGQDAYISQNYSEARRYLGQALAKNPSDRDALFFMGLAAKKELLYDSALLYLKRADIYYPSDREINLQIYEVARSIEAWDEAINALQILIKTGDRPEQHYATLAEMWARNDYPANAYFYIKEALRVDPDNQQLWLQAANLAGIVDSIPLALRYLDSATVRFGEQDHFTSARALYQMNLGNLSEAERLYRRVYTKDTTSAHARLNLAHVLAAYDNNAKKREALALYRSIRGKFGQEFKVDSLIAALDSSLSG